MGLVIYTSWKDRAQGESSGAMGRGAHAEEADVRKAAKGILHRFPDTYLQNLHHLGVLDPVCRSGKQLESALYWIEEELSGPWTDHAQLRLAIALNCLHGLCADLSSQEITRLRIYDACKRPYLTRDFINHRVVLGHGVFDVSPKALRRTPVGNRVVNEKQRAILQGLEAASLEHCRAATRELQDHTRFHHATEMARARARLWSALDPMRIVCQLHIAAAMQKHRDSDHYYTHALELAGRDLRAFLRDMRHGGGAAFLESAQNLVSVPHEFPLIGMGVS